MISLSAEQKSLEGIYCSPTELYIVPQYQRPYSWTFDQCADLFRDIVSAYENKESYFLGNIILARSKSFDINGESFIVDGQQRLITLWTIIKVLAELLPDVNTLKTALYVMPWSGNMHTPKIKSLIFENKDNEAILEVFNYSKTDIINRYNVLTQKNAILKEDKCRSQIEASLLYFYEQISNSSFSSDDNRLMDFSQFLMKRITMLPIVQTADDESKATDKALIIFETINNRGLDLEDADIFKARLYNSAYTDEQRNEFINLWVDFKAECMGLKITIDDIFRYYSHVIRGKEGITTNEKRLRDFFINESFSPLNYSSYNDVLNDLSKILSSLKYIRRNAGIGDASQPGPWIQILLEYTNQYPMYAIVVYLFNHDVDANENVGNFVKFLKALVRYCLITGSTSSVKFGIYPMIKTISFTNNIGDFFQTNISIEDFNHLGRLKNCFALLAYLQETGNCLPEKYSIDKIVNARDEKLLEEDWQYENINEICNSIGNLVVLDIPKKYNSLKEKPKQYSESKSNYVRSIFKNSSFGYNDWKNRNDLCKHILVDFFKGKSNEYNNTSEF